MDSHRILDVPEHGVLDAYEAALALRGYHADPAQRAAALRLQRLYGELLEFKARRRTRLRKWLIHPDLPRSVYLWGGVGRGKSFLMDCFFEAVPYQRKRRIHFHAFMREVHQRLLAHAGEDDPLLHVADEVARATRLLCFDEFHVSHITEAMILGRLLEALMNRGVILVMTSNYPPAGLYPQGLQRQNFLPAIEFIEQHFDVLEVDAGEDYRLRELTRFEAFFVPAGPVADMHLARTFASLSGETGRPARLDVLGRPLAARRVARGVVWFNFAALCEGPRSQNDYLELAREHHTLLLSGIPRLSAANADAARRLTWLIDVLYDCRVKFFASAAAEASELYDAGSDAGEFQRTVSRLVEMRSTAYLAEAHRTG